MEYEGTEKKQLDDHQLKENSRENGQHRCLNPRLVFTDPDVFFADLLMEQNEQQ